MKSIFDLATQNNFGAGMPSPLSPEIQRILGNQGIGTPGIVPGQPAPTAPSGVDGFLSRPSGMLLANILAQSGYSTMPQSGAGALGKALLGTQQGIQQQRQLDLGNDMMRRRLGIQQQTADAQTARAEALGSATGTTNTNVQSVFRTKNGKLGIVRRNGEVEITDNDMDESYNTTTLPSGQVVATNRRDPRDQVEVVDEDVAVQGAARRTGAERTAADQAAADVKSRETLPAEIAQAEDFITQSDKFINSFETGQLGSGPLEGLWRRFTPSGQAFQSFSGEQILKLISSATFGALSEGERKFLEGVTFNIGDDERVNVDKIKRAKKIVEGARDRAIEKMNRIEGNDDFDGFSIAE